MKTTKRQYTLRLLTLVVLLLGIFLSLAGCKKKPTTHQTDPTTEPVLDTTPTTKPTQPEATLPKPTEPKPTEPEETEPEETVSNCDHVLGNWIVETPSNCTTEGSRYKECSLCNQKVETEVIPKTNHSPGTWLIRKRATCQSTGEQVQECSQCSQELLIAHLAKADHNTSSISGYAATESTPGRTDKIYCKTCDATVQESLRIPPIGSVPFTYDINSDGVSCTITGIGDYTDHQLIIPDNIAGYKVSAIGDNAFANRSFITTVYIPKSVTKIGTKAFQGCSGLTNITYQGTTTQWTSFYKLRDWNTGTGEYTVYCTNNSLTK
ncbi:MAG: leucine-rich repeat protein [Oscillospiraceae bacterium]|nr:leucine-rich repeat protein [Oscillospiraceae bacterium]